MAAATLVQPNVTMTRQTDQIEPSIDNFDAIYDFYHGRIFGLAYRMMGNADEALDVTQDAFISAYKNLHRVAPGGSSSQTELNLSAWLYRIATNKCIDALRQRKRRAGIDWDTFVQTKPAASSAAGHPETYAMDQETSAQIQRVLNDMTPNYRMALLLHEYQGFSVREIASAMNRTESAIKSLLFRAREQFRQIYNLQQALNEPAQLHVAA